MFWIIAIVWVLVGIFLRSKRSVFIQINILGFLLIPIIIFSGHKFVADWVATALFLALLGSLITEGVYYEKS